MKKNILIVDADVKFGALVDYRQQLKKRGGGWNGGYVSLEYYFDVPDDVIDRASRETVFYSQVEGQESLLDVLGGMKPFDGISSGMASFARRELDVGDRDGHSKKIRDVIAKVRAGSPDQELRVLRVVHTRNLFQSAFAKEGIAIDRNTKNVVRMFCRSVFVDPDTLDQTDSQWLNPAELPALTGQELAKPDREQLFDFLELRKAFHQSASASVEFSLNVIDPIKDYDTSTMRRIAVGGYDEMRAKGIEWLTNAIKAKEIQTGDSRLTVTGLKGGTPALPRFSGVITFKDKTPTQSFNSATTDQATVTAFGKTLPIRISQDVVMFSVLPEQHRANQYKLAEEDPVCESEFRRMLSESFWY